MANAGPGRIGDALLEREPHLAALAGLLDEVRASSAGRQAAATAIRLGLLQQNEE